MQAENTSLNIYDSPSTAARATARPGRDGPRHSGSGVTYFCDRQGCYDAYPWADEFSAYWACSTSPPSTSPATTRTSSCPSEGRRVLIRLGTVYENLLYVLPGDGSCGSQSCAIRTISLPNQFSPADQLAPRRPGVLTCHRERRPDPISVGLSDGGVRIYNVTTPSSPQLTGTFGGMATGDGSQTPVTALAWDPAGSGLLAVGVISSGNEGFVVKVNANGSLPASWVTWSLQGTSTGVLSAAFGQDPNGNPVVAFGLNDGTLRLIDPTGTGTTDTLAQSNPSTASCLINPIPRFDGSGVGSDSAVSSQATPAPNMVGYGALLRWDGTSAPLTALPVSAGSPNTVTSSWDAFRRGIRGSSRDVCRSRTRRGSRSR